MKNKLLIFFCLTLLITSFSGYSFASNISKTKQINDNATVNFEIDIIQINNNVEIESDNYPYVEITYPEDGSELTNPYLEVLGYAYDPDGLDFMEWTYESGSYYYYENQTLDIAVSYAFRIRVYYLNPGVHTVTVTYYDIYDNGGSDSVTVYYGENNPPETPIRPDGPENGNIGISYTYSTSSSDPDGNNISYGWDWNGDNFVDQWTSFYDSGEIINTAYTWLEPGTYNVKVKAKDTKGATSDFSSAILVNIIDNTAPDKPNTPKGSPSGKTGISYSFYSSTNDTENHRLYYLFDWDDDTEDEWIGPYNSGEKVSVSHIWQSEGTYQVKVKAKDDPNNDGDLSDGMESVWSDSCPVSMPKMKSKIFIEKLLFLILDRVLIWLR